MPRKTSIPSMVLAVLQSTPVRDWTKWELREEIARRFDRTVQDHTIGTRLSELRRGGEPIASRTGPTQVKRFRWVGAR